MKVTRLFVVAMAFVLALVAMPVQAQQFSNPATVNLSLTVPESLTVTTSQGTTLALTARMLDVSGDANTGSYLDAQNSAGFTVTTSWNILSGHTSITLAAGTFSANILTGPSTIPATGIGCILYAPACVVFSNSLPAGYGLNDGAVIYTNNSPAAGAGSNVTTITEVNVGGSGAGVVFQPGSYSGNISFVAELI